MNLRDGGHDFAVGDLQDQGFLATAASMRSIGSLRTWAAAGSIFTGEHDAGLRTGERFPRQIETYETFNLSVLVRPQSWF
jgi:hypothetical protein